MPSKFNHAPCMPREFIQKIIQKELARNARSLLIKWKNKRSIEQGPRLLWVCFGAQRFHPTASRCGVKEMRTPSDRFSINVASPATRPSFLSDYGLLSVVLQLEFAETTNSGCSKNADADTVPVALCSIFYEFQVYDTFMTTIFQKGDLASEKIRWVPRLLSFFVIHQGL